MTTFGLVHGAFHGSWCWERLTAVLESRGHRVLTVDLPCEDPAAGASEYADAAVAAFSAAPEDMVLVGHCPAGVTNSAVQRLRGQFWKISNEVTPLQAWPAVPSSAVIGSRDLVINPDWSRRVTPGVLGVRPTEIDCGHSPFLSAPALLADAIGGGG